MSDRSIRSVSHSSSSSLLRQLLFVFVTTVCLFVASHDNHVHAQNNGNGPPPGVIVNYIDWGYYGNELMFHGGTNAQDTAIAYPFLTFFGRHLFAIEGRYHYSQNTQTGWTIGAQTVPVSAANRLLISPDYYSTENKSYTYAQGFVRAYKTVSLSNTSYTYDYYMFQDYNYNAWNRLYTDHSLIPGMVRATNLIRDQTRLETDKSPKVILLVPPPSCHILDDTIDLTAPNGDRIPLSTDSNATATTADKFAAYINVLNVEYERVRRIVHCMRQRGYGRGDSLTPAAVIDKISECENFTPLSGTDSQTPLHLAPVATAILEATTGAHSPYTYGNRVVNSRFYPNEIYHRIHRTTGASDECGLSYIGHHVISNVLFALVTGFSPYVVGETEWSYNNKPDFITFQMNDAELLLTRAIAHYAVFTATNTEPDVYPPPGSSSPSSSTGTNNGGGGTTGGQQGSSGGGGSGGRSTSGGASGAQYNTNQGYWSGNTFIYYTNGCTNVNCTDTSWSGDSGTEPLLPALIGVLGLCLVIAVVVIVLLQCRKKSRTTNHAGADDYDRPARESDMELASGQGVAAGVGVDPLEARPLNTLANQILVQEDDAPVRPFTPSNNRPPAEPQQVQINQRAAAPAP